MRAADVEAVWMKGLEEWVDRLRKKRGHGGARPPVGVQIHQARVGRHTVTPPEGWQWKAVRDPEGSDGLLFYLPVAAPLAAEAPVIHLSRIAGHMGSPRELLQTFWAHAGAGEWMSHGTSRLRDGLAADVYSLRSRPAESDHTLLLTFVIVRCPGNEDVVLTGGARQDLWDLVEEPFRRVQESLILDDDLRIAATADRELAAVDRIRISRLLELERRSHLQSFGSVIQEYMGSEGASDWQAETIYRLTDEAPGIYATVRVHLRFLQGDCWSNIRVSKEPLAGFTPVRFRTAQGLAVTIAPPLAWSRVRLAVSGRISDWQPFEEWVAHWLLEERRVRVSGDLELAGVLCSVLPPRAAAGRMWTEIDFGSAPVDALWEMLDVLARMGADRVDLDSEEPAAQPV